MERNKFEEQLKSLKQKQVQSDIRSKLPKVVSRQRKAECKRVKESRHQLLLKENRQRDIQNMNRAVQKYQFRPKVDKDFKRVKQLTECQKNRNKTEKEQPLFQVYGNSNERLFRDIRFRLQTYLYEKGAQQNPFANQLLGNLYKKNN
jgi:hypothetical protein